MLESKLDGPAAWRPADFGSLDDFSVRLTEAHLEVLTSWVGDPARPIPETTLADYRHPELDRDLAGIRRELIEGRGLVLLRGFPVSEYDEAAVERMYWGVGTHLGRGISQSARGDRMGYVRDETKPGAPESARGYLSRRGLGLHSDFAELVGLLCVRPSRTGGTSLVASTFAMRNAILEEHPEFLPVYHRGFPYHRRGEEAPDAEPVTPYEVPIFSVADGVLSSFYVRGILDVTFRELGRELTALEQEALEYFDELSVRDDIRLEIDLEAGDALLLNNCSTLHARTRFSDWDEPTRKRLYYRLWLEGYERRPLVPEFMIYRNASGHMGIDAQEGREPARPEYLVPARTA